ncbi:hypothetical protein KO495_02855 [Colwellia sp. D2M02]|uniref:tetratricopeptide repeat protein n=1 Tax=Colwellia sp. D2M02 TaxID=2841562 RepID=UPI001C0810C5|nr:hypothetical protein [Colwellia sp. D2M02]MBU2892260.1 hypothetical protein [Colwellia sp. D2M02]
MMKLIHGVKLVFFTVSLTNICMSESAIATPQSKLVASQQTLEQLYYQRDYQSIKEILNALNRPLKIDEQLLMLAIKVQRDEDDADDALESLTNEHQNNAKVQYWAGNLWQIVAKNSSMFSKMSIYSHYVKAMTKAAKLAPQNARYQMEAAKAYGQPSIMGGDSDKQAPIVAKLLQGSSQFAHIAQMDLLQNTQKESEAIHYATGIAQQYSNNVEIVERAAQLLWTFGDKDKAGEFFYQACMLPAPIKEPYLKWSAACWYSVLFSDNGELSLEQGITAGKKLLAQSSVKDNEYLESLELYAQLLVKARQTANAINAYNDLLASATNKSMKRKAKEALKKLSK